MKEKLITLLLLVAASMNWIGCSKQQTNPEIAADSALTQFIDENYVYIHVLYAGKDDAPSLASSTFAGRGGFFG